MNLFTKIYRLSWLVLVSLLVFLDRQNSYWVITTILLLLILGLISILRSIESRNEWREYIIEDSLDENIK